MNTYVVHIYTQNRVVTLPHVVRKLTFAWLSEFIDVHKNRDARHTLLPGHPSAPLPCHGQLTAAYTENARGVRDWVPKTYDFYKCLSGHSESDLATFEP
jgi:hypothetical protein